MRILGVCLALVILLVAFASFAGAASAYSNTGMDVSPATVSRCPGDTETLELALSNNDDATHTYELMLELPQGWSGFIQPAVTLASGESDNIMFWITPSTVNPGVYNARLVAKVGVESTSKDIPVEVLGCHIVSIDVQDAMEVCADSEFQFSFSVSNFGKEAEEFETTATASWLTGKDAELHTESAIIESGKAKQISFNVKTPEATGTIKVKAVSKTSYASAEKQTQLNVNKCYDFTLDMAPNEAPACLGGSAEFALTVKNTGTAADVYLIDAPEWVKPSQANVTVLPGEERSVSFFAYPAAKGKTSFAIKVTSRNYPKAAKEATAAVEANECKGVAVIVSPAEQEACMGTPAEFTVTLKNTGMATDSYELVANYGSFGEKTLKIEAGEIKEATLIVDTSGMETGEASVTVTAKSGEIMDQNSAKLKIKNCYAAEFGVSPETAEACDGDEIQYTLVLKNTGLFTDNYTVTLQDEEIGFVTLEPGELKMFSSALRITGFEEGEHDLVFRAVSQHVSKEAITKITVKPDRACYNIEISSDSAKSVVEPGNGIALAVRLKNAGQKQETFALSLEGPAWLHLNQEAVTLGPGEEGTVYLYASPGYDVKKSVYQASFRAQSETTESEMIFRIGVGVVPEDETAKANGIRLPTGAITGMVMGTTGKVILLALIVAIILIILVVKFVLFVK